MTQTIIPASKRRFAALLALTILFVVVFDQLFNWAFFAKLDYGWQLEKGRRILEGQLPYRDFISIHPMLTPLLHMHLLLWAGDWIFRVERLYAWLLYSIIAWCWADLVTPRRSRSITQSFSIFLLIYSCLVHRFQLMPWHTYDGLLFSSIAIWLKYRVEKCSPAFPLFLAGCAGICKQNFAIVGLLLWWSYYENRRIKDLIFWCLPAIMHFGVLGLFGAFPDAVDQILSGSDSKGLVGSFSTTRILVIVLLLIPLETIHAFVFQGVKFVRFQKIVIFDPLKVLLVLLSGSFLFSIGRIYIFSTYIYFIAVIHFVFMKYIRKEIGTDMPDKGLCFLMLSLNFVASISIGNISHDFLIGCVLFWLMSQPGLGFVCLKPENHRGWFLVAILSLVSLAYHRSYHAFLTKSDLADQTYSLAPYIKGSNGIFCDRSFMERVQQLKVLTDESARNGRLYYIYPNDTAFWVRSAQTNPSNATWPADWELPSPELKEKFAQSLARWNDRIDLIVELPYSFINIQDDVDLDQIQEFFMKDPVFTSLIRHGFVVKRKSINWAVFTKK